MDLRHLLISCVPILLAAAPAPAQERADALLVVADDGGLDASDVRAIRSVTAAGLRKKGVEIAEDGRTVTVRPVDASLRQLVAEMGARRVFVLRVGGRLGQKIPLSLEELDPSLSRIYSASLTAIGLEECDIIAERLVTAVLERRPAESTAELKTVSAAESKPFAKKPGERFWFIGLPVALFNSRAGGSPLGFTLGYAYEADIFRVMATAGGFGRADEDISFLVMEAAWVPLQGEVSPYVSGGLGYMGAADASGLGGMVEGGLELFRLHGMRALVGVQGLIPFFDTTLPTRPRRTVYSAAFVRLAF